MSHLTTGGVVKGIRGKVTAFQRISLIGLLAVLVSSSELTIQAQKYPPQGITGNSVDWVETSTLESGSPERIHANRVAALTKDAPPYTTNHPSRFCTGFLVGPDLLMTNDHCTRSRNGSDTYAGTIAVFNFENGVDPSQLEAFRCDTLVRRDILIDVALLRCQAGPIGSSSPVLPGDHRGRGFIDLEDYSELQDGDDIYVINQNCVDGGLTTPPFTNRTCVPTKKLSRGDLLNYYCPNPGTKLGRGYFFDLFHNADTLPGSSGSPIFSATTHKIVGIHKCCTPRRDDGTIIDGRAPSSGNEGTRAKQLLDFANSINLRLVDIFLIVDLSGSFWDDLATFKTQATGIVNSINRLKAIGISPRVGLAKFEDYPISPFGSAADGDKAYERLVDLVDPAQDTDGDGTSDIVEVIQGLFTRHGGDKPESQYAALFQAATGQGQDVNGDGDTDDVADISPCQQASFRPNALKITILWTDAPFHNPGDPGTIPYPGPSRDETIAAQRGLILPLYLEQGAGGGKGVRVIGISSGGGGSSELQDIAQETGAVASSGGVDCDGDGSIDIPEGAPLVCGIATDGTGIGEAIESTVESIFESADLSVFKTDSPDPVNSGSNLTYTLSVTNNGPGDATGVTATDILPAGVTFVSATPSQGACNQAGGTITCNLGTLNNGAAATITIVVIPNMPGTITNTATATANESDPNAGDNTGTATTTVNLPSADEGFETGNFSRFPWQTGGQGRWVVTNTLSHAGNYSAMAPTSIRDRQQSFLQVTLTVEAGMVSFWRKVSSEQNSDFLRFYIDGVMQGEWSGEMDWEQVSFPVAAGRHTFRWVYIKDRSVSTGQDTAWLDDIDFPLPPCYGVTVSSSPASVIYRPTATRPARATIRVTVRNDGGVPQTVSGIVVQAGEPFTIVSISPALPRAVSNKRSQMFRVLTERGAGQGTAKATKPYFNISMDCGTLTKASEPRLLVPLQLNNVEVEADLRAEQLHVRAQGMGIASVQLQLYNLAGQLILDQENKGDTLALPARTAQGRLLANGVYLYVVRVRGFNEEEYVSEVRKLVILR